MGRTVELRTARYPRESDIYFVNYKSYDIGTTEDVWADVYFKSDGTVARLVDINVGDRADPYRVVSNAGKYLLRKSELLVVTDAAGDEMYSLISDQPPALPEGGDGDD